MSTFNDIGKKLGEVAEITVNKAKKLAEILRLNSCISAEESKMEEAYIEIGKVVYEQIKDQATGSLGELCGKVQEKKWKIEQYKMQIEQVKNS